jgi:peptide/nickel transport system permease protein
VRFILRRTLQALFLLFGVSVVSFLMFDLAPGDYLSEMRLNPQISAETLNALRQQYGLDEPVMVRYARWLASSARGEFGYSFSYNRHVGPLLIERATNTLILTATSTLIVWVVAIVLGTISASRRGTWFDRLLSSVTTLLLSVPDLLIALAFLLIALRTGWFPAGGMTSLESAELPWLDRVRDLAWHMIIPVATLVLPGLPLILRQVRSAMIDVLAAPYMQAAKAHGIPQWRLLFRYALPAAANSLISLFGLSIAGLLSGSLLVEVIMSWPGLGPLLLEAVLARDLYVVIGAIFCSTIFLVLGSILADLLLVFTDPRIRAEAAA